jgi:hypothetical protein
MPEERAPLDDPVGRRDVRRDVALAFEQLGAGDRLWVVSELGLLIPEAASMRSEHLIRAVSESVYERDIASQFFDAVKRVRS